MPASSAFEKLPRFGTVLFTLSLSALLLGLGIGALTLLRYSEQLEQTVQSRTTQRSALAMQAALNGTVDREWQSLSSVAMALDLSSDEKMADLVDAVPQIDTAIGWAAVLAPSGKVVAATGGQALGEDFSDISWFRSGLQKRVAVPAKAGDGLMLAQPILRGGEPEGVLVYRLKRAALAATIAPIARQFNKDTFIVDAAGHTVLAATLFGRDMLSPAEQIAIRQGDTGQTAAAVTKGELLSVASWNAGPAMPHIPWTLVLRSPDRLHAGILDHAKLMAVLTYLGLGAVVALVLVLWIGRYAYQIAELARVSLRMADGELLFPPQYAATREAAQLSSALVRMQTQLSEQPAAGPAPRKPVAPRVAPRPSSPFTRRKQARVANL